MTDTDRATELPSRLVRGGALSTEELIAWGVPADEIDGFLDLAVPFARAPQLTEARAPARRPLHKCRPQHATNRKEENAHFLPPSSMAWRRSDHDGRLLHCMHRRL